MFIEVAEMLRCPEPHEESFCVVAPEEMAGRMILRGVIGCPVCRTEFPIRDGVAEFGSAPQRAPESGGSPDLPEAEAVAALLGLGGPGGYVVLVGAAASLAENLAEWLPGVHFIGINPTAGVSASPILSLLVCDRMVPLRSSMARGVVIGPDLATEFWVGEAARILLRGLRVVVLGRESCQVAGLGELAKGTGMWVGEKTASVASGR
ncbi:hypothetical protein HRbin33_00358 [bacterium HR33]|nr:hypothetical protein HRbin33_00358 [bacterium HR33]